MPKKEIPIFKPGPFGKFFYYLSESLNFLFLIIIIPALSINLIMYVWAMINERSVPIRLFTYENGVWSWMYQLQNLIGILFLWLFVYMIKQNVTDLISSKETALIKIWHKGIDYTGHTPGIKTYYIKGEKESFAITEKAYNKLNVGDTVKIKYTKTQRNVRMITLLKSSVYT